MKKQLIIVALLIFCFSKAQVNIGGIPYLWKSNLKTEIDVPVFSTPNLNLQQLEVEDNQDQENNIPPRFGYKHEVSLTLENSGVWAELENGDKLWQLEIYCPNAKSINFTFDEFWLPENGKLYVYGKDKQHYIGGFTELNNKGTKQNVRGFGTGLVYSDKVIIEYYQPKEDEDAIISINGIVHGYRYIAKFWENSASNKTDDFGGSGDCQVNVNCSPEGDDWQDEKTGVALILVNGNRYCSGSLINNSCNDGKLYFLTADHCTGGWANNPKKDAATNPNADDCTFLWNYEAPNCSNPSSEPSLYTTSGATLKANNSLTDFALFELDESPYELNPQQKVLFNGWNRAATLLNGGACIHHPSGDIKKISIYEQTPYSNFCNSSGGNNNTWGVIFKHSSGHFSSTQQGSSGSPLFDINGNITGQLWTGYNKDNCAYGPECSDASKDVSVFGKLSISWDSNSDIKKQLKHWLGSCGSSLTELEGGYLDEGMTNVVVNYPLSNTALIQANNKVEGSSIVGNTSDVEFRAGQEVVLKPGFHAQAGSNFLAHIAPCSPMVIPVASKNENSTEIE